MMLRRVVLLLLLLGSPVVCVAEQETQELLRKAMQQLTATGYSGDTSSAERYLQAILERQPDHLEARWQLIYLRLASLENSSLSDRVEALSQISEEFSRLTQAIQESKQAGFLHYVTAIHAGYYKAYDRALREIHQALVVAPTSARYLAAKGKLLIASGNWSNHDAEIEDGIRVLKQARGMTQGPFESAAGNAMYDFYLAGALAGLTHPRWREVAEHYERFIAQSSPSTAYAFALNNVSIAYTHLGACDKARDAAKQALVVMSFGAAESNKRHAEFCLEMQHMGLLAKP
ncbi:MAG: hypothetical protein KA240_02205 [Nitrospira sp.]|nr:hypothetical protein [Nitrospira sp.]MBP6604468.1 hypothetical protein [Nitrospira sp.]HQY58912.1 hypothetical protein [Nitrospira sp.]HRA96382.1 hypothetical protein [Nitrospira sp.]